MHTRLILAIGLVLIVLPLRGRADVAAPTSLPVAPQPVPSGLGVNIHFTRPGPNEMSLLADAGFSIVRMDFDWAVIEKERGRYDFTAYENLLAALEPHGIRALFILDYANPLYDNNRSPHTDQGRRAFAAWAAAAARHFAGRGILWEMYNEPNISPFWRPQPNTEHYIQLALEVGKAIRAAAPGEIFVGPASSTFDWPFLEACFKAGLLEYWSAVTVHPYRPHPPERVAADYRRLRLLTSRYAPRDKTIPIYSGEWGYSSVWSGMDEQKQGEYLPRQWLTNIANDVPVSIWYDWHDDGPDPKEPEHHFGTVGLDFSPKPAYAAAKKLTQELRGFRFNKRLWIGRDDAYLLLFTNDVEAKIAGWTTATEDRTVDVPGLLTTTLTNRVQYLTPKKTPLLAKLVAWERAPLDRIVQAPAVAGDRKLTRGDHSMVLETRFPDEPRITQRTTVSITNAIALTVCAPRTWFEVHLSNPSGEPFEGALSRNGSEPVPFQFTMGQTTAAVTLPDGATKDRRERVRLLDEHGQVVIDHPTVRFASVPFYGKDEIAVRAHGDAEVKSSQSFTSGGAPVLLCVKYAFEPGWKYVTVETIDQEPREITGKPKSLAMWVLGDGSGAVLRARFIDSTGQTFQPDGPNLDFTDWRYVAFPLDETAQGHWGGANDGIVHYPIRLEALLLIDNVSRAECSGSVEVMMPALIYEE